MKWGPGAETDRLKFISKVFTCYTQRLDYCYDKLAKMSKDPNAYLWFKSYCDRNMFHENLCLKTDHRLMLTDKLWGKVNFYKKKRDKIN